MNSQKINDWLQIVGLFGVIGSLIFVGLQLKQTQEIALSDTYQGRAGAAIDLGAAVLSSPELLSGFAKLYEDRTDEFTMQEAIAVEWWLSTEMLLIENNHHQYQAGFLSQEHWERNLAEMRCNLTVPFFREIMLNWDFRESFRAVITDMMQAVPGEADNCWSGAYDWDYAAVR